MQVAGRSDGRSGALAREWELSGALGTAFRPRGDGDRIPPFQVGRGVLSRRPRGGCPTGFRLTIKLIIVSLIRSSDPLKTPVGQRYKHGAE